MRKVIGLLFVLMMVACGNTSDTPDTPDAKAEMIVCTAAYRSSVSSPIEREESLTFEDADAEQSLTFADLVFYAAYDAGEGDNERTLRTWVMAINGSITYNSQLYQLSLDSGPENQFIGGHGFTGLNYTYHPTSAAELQFWCESR
jgi:hypothetical protein